MNMFASPNWLVERERKGSERASEWNSLCWLVEREREREGGRLPFEGERDPFQVPQDIPLISWKSRLQVLYNWLA
jgi:hypothetical protein